MSELDRMDREITVEGTVFLILKSLRLSNFPQFSLLEFTLSRDDGWQRSFSFNGPSEKLTQVAEMLLHREFVKTFSIFRDDQTIKSMSF